jgi:hypothetical protein
LVIVKIELLRVVAEEVADHIDHQDGASGKVENRS